MLDRDLDDLEDQYLMALRGHMRSLAALLDLQHLRIKGQREEFEGAIEALEGEFDAERVEIQNGHARHKKDLEDILHAMQASVHVWVSGVACDCIAAWLCALCGREGS